MNKPNGSELEQMRKEYKRKVEKDERISRLALQYRLERKTRELQRTSVA